MPNLNFPQNQAKSQAIDASSNAAQARQHSNTVLDQQEACFDHIPLTIMSRQKFTALQAASGVSIRHRLVDFRLLVSAVLATTADQKLSYGTENGYDVADIAGHYNALARARGLSELTAPAIEFHLKKPEFTALMLMVFEHLTAQKLKVGIEDADVKKVLALISSAVGKPITDLRATDGCYFCVAASLAKWFPASRTAHKEGSKGAAQIGIQACLSLKSKVFIAAEITGGTAYEPNYVPIDPNTITLADAAFGTYASFVKFEDNDAFQVAKGRSNLAAKVCEAYVDGKKVKDINGKKLKEFLRYDVGQRIELVIEGECRTESVIVVDSNGVATVTKPTRKVKLRAIRIFEPGKGWTWVLTNLPSSVPAAAVLTLMRLRWTIERAFLDLKSHNNLRGARTNSRHLAQTMVWASMITALIKLVTIRCAELRYGRSLSLRRCHKLDQHEQEKPSWSITVITLLFGRALPGASFAEVLHRLGSSKHTGVSKPSAKNRRRMIAHHLVCLIFELGGDDDNEVLLLPYRPMLKSA